MEQIDLLANFIMAEVEGEPSQDEGAGDCAIRIIKQLKEENERLKEGHEDIIIWGNAYPVGMFTEPDLKKAHELLKAGGITLDAVSASAMRHVLKGVVKIAKDALKDGG